MAIHIALYRERDGMILFSFDSHIPTMEECKRSSHSDQLWIEYIKYQTRPNPMTAAT